MAVARYYASNAVDTTLSAGISSADLTMTVGSVSGFPGSYPYTLAIDYDTSSEELVDVTYASGTTLTITRAVDSTTAVSHASAAPVKHVISGRDLRETQEHYNATGRYSVTNGTTTEYFNLHGIGLNEGNVVGTDKTQTLTAKTLTSPTINGATLGGTTTNSGTITGGTIVASSVSASGLTGSTLASGVTASSLTSFGSGATINSATLDAASTIGGVSGTTIAADHAAWSTYTPTLGGTGWSWSGTATGRYKQIGKTVFFNLNYLSSATLTAGTGALTFTLPVTPLSGGTGGLVNGTITVGINTSYNIQASIVPNSTTLSVYTPGANTTANQGLLLQALTSSLTFLNSGSSGNRSLLLSGFYEVA